MPKSFDRRSVDYLKKEGWPIAEVVACSAGRYSRDLMGFIDVWAFHPERGHLFVQVTSRSNIAARRRKILEEHHEDAKKLLVVRYNYMVIHGWDKPKHRWRLKEIDMVDLVLSHRPDDI